ncbi:MAG: MATE family efflux transporter [Coriobacteriales bacterium]|nr:MATE family efflux transporter [Coriobacteriales bacterium]
MSTIEYQYENKLIRKSSTRYIVPAMIGLVFGQLSPMVGGICISQSLGEVPFSALSTVEPVNLIFSALGALGGVGCGITVSKCSGSGDKDVAARAFTRTVVALAVATVVLAAVTFVFTNPILRFLQATPENMGYAREYLHVVLLGSLFIVFMFAGDYILTDDNDPQLVLVASVTSAIINVVLNLVLLEGFHMGIGASAFAMVFGEFVAVLMFIPHFRKKGSLCRFVPPRKHEGDPSTFSILKPGTPMCIMYLMFAIQMIVQNLVLGKESGTSGLGNSAVIDNLVLFLTIFTASASEPVMALASSYHGEENKCGTLLVKRDMYKFGLCILVPIILILVLFPQVFMALFAIKDPVMLESLPFAIRIVCLSSLLTFTNDSLVNYLSATEREPLANVSYGIQIVVSISATLLLARVVPMDAPWYGTMLANACACVFMLGVGRLVRGFVKMYPENLVLLTGGEPEPDQIAHWEELAAEVLDPEQVECVEDKLFPAFENAIAQERPHMCSFTVLERDNGDKAAILRFDHKVNLFAAENEDETDEEELAHVYNTCVASEFNTLHRLMINFQGHTG